MSSAVARSPDEQSISRVCMDQAVREPGCSMTKHHCHSYFELYIVEAGSCRCMLGDSIHELSEGDCIIIPPQTFHHTRYLAERCKRSNVYFRWVDLDRRVRNAFAGTEDFFARVRILHVPGPKREPIFALLGRMAAEELQGDARTESLQYLHLQELLIMLNRVGELASETPDRLHAADQQTLLAARYISSNYMNPITAADIAAAAGFSPNYLSRRFREAAGIGVHEYLVFTRLQHAAEELLSTSDSITAIALRCGFSDSNYFKDAFKKRYGMTPRAYRGANCV